MLILTDIGHDPDDAIALSYLIENDKKIDYIIIFPGHFDQIKIASSILKSYKLQIPLFVTDCDLETKYEAGKHSVFLSKATFSYQILESNFEVNEALIIGPPHNLGNKLKANKMVFQGGYSPNSIHPLPKFQDIQAIHSHNPCHAKTDFNLLLETKEIASKYYVGKNVCHGFTKAKLSHTWVPSNSLLRKFWDSLEDDKAMHDVLAAQCLLNKKQFQWENAKPIWFGDKLSTIPTTENIWTLI